MNNSIFNFFFFCVLKEIPESWSAIGENEAGFAFDVPLDGIFCSQMIFDKHDFPISACSFVVVTVCGEMLHTITPPSDYRSVGGRNPSVNDESNNNNNNRYGINRKIFSYSITQRRDGAEVCSVGVTIRLEALKTWRKKKSGRVSTRREVSCARETRRERES